MKRVIIFLWAIILSCFYLSCFITSPVMGGEYVGCFKDQGDPLGTKGRDLNGYFFQDPNMTVETCISVCRQRGFKYAGVQYSKHCFCGNSYGKFGRANNCNMRCMGNPAEFCGGFWANSVYKVVGVITNTQEGGWQKNTGFEYNTDRPGLDYKSFSLPSPNPQLCKQACSRDPMCKAWTYVKPNTIQGPRPKCWLKYDVPSPVKSRYCISGVKGAGVVSNPRKTTISTRINLTGTWKCDDGGMYYIRQIGKFVWWYGERSPNSPQWSNVAFGKIQGNRLKLKWADVPKGNNLYNGALLLRIISNNRLEAIRKTGGFGGSNWYRH